MTTENEQAVLWNGLAGRMWVAEEELLEQVFRPVEELLVQLVCERGGGRVLDVGCGTGIVTRAVGRRGGTVGVDISEPMIAAARERAEREGVPATFICADAQSYAFEASSFDIVISRFGVMFFEDPVRAFENLRRAVRDGGELRMIVWRGGDENPFMTTAERAASALLPNLPPRQPGAPGQFAFADREKVRNILEQSGWGEIGIEPVDVGCTMAETDLVRYFSRLGPVGRALQEVDEETRARVVEVARAAFEPYVHGPEVRFTAACWMMKAVAPHH
jgi:ubiquinone/menaquinone biosynthesis C-methylase UbiE